MNFDLIKLNRSSVAFGFCIPPSKWKQRSSGQLVSEKLFSNWARVREERERTRKLKHERRYFNNFYFIVYKFNCRKVMSALWRKSEWGKCPDIGQFSSAPRKLRTCRRRLWGISTSCLPNCRVEAGATSLLVASTSGSFFRVQHVRCEQFTSVCYVSLPRQRGFTEMKLFCMVNKFLDYIVDCYVKCYGRPNDNYAYFFVFSPTHSPSLHSLVHSYIVSQ